MRPTTAWPTLVLAAIATAQLISSTIATAQQTAPRQSTPQLLSQSPHTPYQATIDNSTCEEATFCQVTFKPVPAHMRLVITQYNATASFTTSTTNNFVDSTLSGAGDGVINTFLHTTPTPGFSFVNEETLMYFEAAQTPTAQAANSAGLIDFRATISGYLVRTP